MHERTGRSAESGVVIADFDDVSLDSVLTTTSNPRRKRVLAHLAERNEPVGVEALAAAIAAGADESAADGLIAASLHHVHLPKLAGLGLAEYDRDDRTAVATERGVRLAARIDQFPRADRVRSARA